MKLNIIQSNPIFNGILVFILFLVPGHPGWGKTGSMSQDLVILYSSNTSGFAKPSG